MTCGIYSITNSIDNKSYIGYSVNIEKRWNHHISSLNNNKHDNSYLQNSWNKHRKENFIFKIIEKCPKSKLIEKEKYYIKKLKTKRPLGYNLNDGGKGNLGWEVTEETSKRKSEAVKGEKNPMYGKKHSKKTIELFSKQRIGTKNGVGNKNNLHLIKRYKNSKSKYFGVSVDGYKKKNGEITLYWKARISIDGKDKYLGKYRTETEAAEAFDEECWKIYKDKSKLNFPENYE